MNLGFYDLHVVLDPSARRLTVWDVHHREVFSCEARNRTTADEQFGRDGNCPPGEFLLGPPSPRGSVPFGPYFVALLDYDGHHAMGDHGRSGIGIHGGGTGLESPFADRQGWQITHGCWRVQNTDLLALVQYVKAAQRAGGACYATVHAPTPGAELGVDDWGPAVGLFPDE